MTGHEQTADPTNTASVPVGLIEAMVDERVEARLAQLAGRLLDGLGSSGLGSSGLGSSGLGSSGLGSSVQSFSGRVRSEEGPSGRAYPVLGELAQAGDRSVSEVDRQGADRPYPRARLEPSVVAEPAVGSDPWDRGSEPGGRERSMALSPFGMEQILHEIGRVLFEMVETETTRVPTATTARKRCFPRTASQATATLPETLVDLLDQSLTAKAVAERLGVNSSRIRQRLAERSLFGFKHGRSWYLPLCQFENDRPIPGVEQVFPELQPDLAPLAVVRWFSTPWTDLVIDEASETVVSPRDWLLRGHDPAPVAAQAMML